MGKSAGKWIKTVLFGKKYSKSNLSKNVTPDKKTAVKTVVDDLAGNSPVISDPCQFTDRDTESLELEKGASDSIASLSLDPNVDSQSNLTSIPISDAERRRLEQAATKAQAAFRGYLARRAFRALKGIIRLQALIRGHLVRRQAVATLRCMHAIVKFQALARGRKVRLSYGSPEVLKKYDMGEHQVAKQGNFGANSFFNSEKLATNAFVHKLLVTLPTAMLLSLQYDVAEANSAWNWLERWSISRFWEPPTRPKKTVKAKPQRKQGITQIVESEAGKSKRTIRKGPTAAIGDNNALASPEMDKPKRHPRKVTSHQTESVPDQPQNELERVKRNLRKVSASAAAAAAAAATSEKLETETEKPQPIQSVEIVASELEVAISSENPADSDVVVDKMALPETPSKTIIDEAVDTPHDDHPVVETQEIGEKLESALTLDDESSCKEEQQSVKENQKIKKRRSLPANKQEYTENITQNNSPSLPSYMLATVSAKAKLRAQGSSKVGEDGAESGYVRRHSLPAPTNGKLSSLSPRIQKPVQANGKGGTKTNKSLTTSRDDKALQPGWRR
ncbi:hypothetical protein BUALT_Bualt04G0147800 [Buddleja alternifolia]|uniref:DUF4005 domain-containing protein n=1 Tax=Buddleja alternifolia TaxID=168488 RepID=A0AAV6XX88_9LAMI|nr:hypothetical protein BUALT_Bualt04G0147800 [Buddleja alternifolia]